MQGWIVSDFIRLMSKVVDNKFNICFYKLAPLVDVISAELDMHTRSQSDYDKGVEGNEYRRDKSGSDGQ